MRCLNTRKITSDPDDAISEIRDKSVTIVDVRRPEEYKKNHIHSAVNLPLSELLSDDSPERVAKLVGAIGIDDSTRTIIYDDTFGALSSRLAWSLEYLMMIVRVESQFLASFATRSGHHLRSS